MTKPWYKRDPDRYAREKQRVQERYPELRFYEDEPLILIHGAFPVLDKHGETLDRYRIEILVPPSFPENLPIVFEVGERIPRHLDRHIVNQKGQCCLETEVDFRARHGADYNLVDFLDGPVRSFFADQSHFEETGEWPHGERSHGSEGMFESYEEILGTTDREAICRWVYYLAQQEVNLDYDCPCGSGLPIRNCHQEQFARLRDRIPSSAADKSLRDLARHPDFSLVL